MIAYICKYAPVEILEAFGTPVGIMDPDVTNFTQADTLMHPNICSFIKAVLEEFENDGPDGMLLTTCCDSSRRLYDTLCRLHPDKFFFCIDLPRKNNGFSAALYAEEMERLIEEYEAFSGRRFDAGRLAGICAEKAAARDLGAAEEGGPHDLNLCLAGARPGPGIRQLLDDMGARISLDLTCTGITREYKIETEKEAGGSRKALLKSYAAALLGQMPCMRMAQADGRAEALVSQTAGIDGILYHTVKFCDIYSYEYTRFRQTMGIPIVKVETDATGQCAGQIRTRAEAFLESLRAGKKDPAAAEKQSSSAEADREGLGAAGRFSECDGCPDRDAGASAAPRIRKEDIAEDGAGAPASRGIRGDRKMYIMGIDSGSTSTNAVIINEKKEILSYAVLRTGAKSTESAERIMGEVLDKAGLRREELSRIVSTGYGRVSIPFADKNVTEISCHGRGAHFLNPDVRTILDIGGQDSKAIRINENGNVTDFVMNDKCAAGTGRFLEMMARTLEVDIGELGPLSLRSKEDVEISSMCSVFAESEVISLIAQNKEPADIARGVHRAIAGKAVSLLKKAGPEREFMMTGGVAKNPGMVAVLEEMLDTPLFIYEEPEIVGALGAALFALE